MGLIDTSCTCSGLGKMADIQVDTRPVDHTTTFEDGGLLDKMATLTGHDLQYTATDKPPWGLSVFLGFQHYLVMFISSFSLPLIYASALCLPIDGSDICDVINTLLFVSGITTLLQTTFGIRLPIVQGSALSYLFPLLATLSQPQWKCPTSFTSVNQTTFRSLVNSSNVTLNDTEYVMLDNMTSGDMVDVPWKTRMREIQGGIITASVFQVLAGATGMMQGVIQYIGPLTIAPTIAIIGMSLFGKAAEMCSLQWGISILTVLLVTIFSQYMGRVLIPCRAACSVSSKRKKSHLKYPFFSMFALILATLVSWALCFVLTISGVLGEVEKLPGYHARTDLKTSSLVNTAWFRVPYPGQWGAPTFSLSTALAMISGAMASIIESIGDYYACARISGVPPPPAHAINRGILAEGLGCTLSGLMGSGLGSTSFSQNIAVISITKVASLRVIQIAGLFMIGLSIFGKFAAVFVCIPTPVIGGLFLVMFGMVTSVGLSSLHHVDLTSSRNLYILGISLLTGLSVPHWVDKNMDVIKTGVNVLDQVIIVLLNTGMLIAGIVAFVLDNTVPGTLEQRGILSMKAEMVQKVSDSTGNSCCYDVPYCSKLLERFRWTRRIPFCHNYEGCGSCMCRCCWSGSVPISDFDGECKDTPSFSNSRDTPI